MSNILRSCLSKFALFLWAASLAPIALAGCPDCQDEKCVPFLGCACIPRIACVVPIPIPGTAPPGQLPTPIPGVSVPSPVQIPSVGQDAIKAAEKGVKDIADTIVKAKQDTDATISKAADDTKGEAGRAGRQVEDAGKAVVRYVQQEVASEGKVLSNAERRLREGKVVDAFWHMGTERLQATDDNAAAAAQESELLRTVGSVAATAYGGPGGAAAYAAWLTYKQTGDANLALRVGILTGASSAAFGAAGNMPAGTAYEVAQKTVVTGAIGGLAVAAAGGSDEAIKAGFLSAGSMVLVQDGYKSFTGHALDGRSSEGDAYCMRPNEACSPPTEAMLQKDANGNVTLDMSKVDPRVPAVGMKVDSAKVTWQMEQSPLMTSVSRVPGMQAMAVFHDTWTMGWSNDLLVKATIVPAIVLTYTGTGAPYYDLVRKTAIDSAVQAKYGAPAESSQTPSTAASSAAVPTVALPDVPFASSVTLPRPSKAVSVAYSCATGEQSRSIWVETNRRKSDGSICRISYKRQEGTAELFASSRDRAACERRAASIVTKSVGAGWSCVVGSSKMQADRAQRIAREKKAG